MLAAVATSTHTSLTGATIASVYNSSTAPKVWCGSATATSCVATFTQLPPTPLQTLPCLAQYWLLITNVQTNAVSATINIANIPNTWVYSASASPGCIVGCVIANGSAVANITQISYTVTGY